MFSGFLASPARFERAAFRLGEQRDPLKKARVLGKIPRVWIFRIPYVAMLAHVSKYGKHYVVISVVKYVCFFLRKIGVHDILNYQKGVRKSYG